MILEKLNGNPIKRVSKTDYLGLTIDKNVSSLYIYDSSSEKYRGSTGHRNSLNFEMEIVFRTLAPHEIFLKKYQWHVNI